MSKEYIGYKLTKRFFSAFLAFSLISTSGSLFANSEQPGKELAQSIVDANTRLSEVLAEQKSQEEPDFSKIESALDEVWLAIADFRDVSNKKDLFKGLSKAGWWTSGLGGVLAVTSVVIGSGSILAAGVTGLVEIGQAAVTGRTLSTGVTEGKTLKKALRMIRGGIGGGVVVLAIGGTTLFYVYPKYRRLAQAIDMSVVSVSSLYSSVCDVEDLALSNNAGRATLETYPWVGEFCDNVRNSKAIHALSAEETSEEDLSEDDG